MDKNIITIYHNPRCAKSREALALIDRSGQDYRVVEYLKNPPTFSELKDLLIKLNLKPFEIIRTKEDLFKRKFKGRNFTDDEWIKVLTENPILIERPIIFRGNKAVIGRSPELVNEIIKKSP